MLSLKPFKAPDSVCPKCQHHNGFQDYMFYGAHILGHGTCNNCQVHYHHNWPVGHGAQFPVVFTDNGLASFDVKAKLWLAQPLIEAVKHGWRIDPPIRRLVRFTRKNILLLNCLDPCYGHVIWKLLNASRYRELAEDQGLIVILPHNCVWMVPDHVAEVWSVDAPLHQLHARVVPLDDLVRSQMSHYNSIRIVPVMTHMDHQGMDLSQYFKCRSFDLGTFGQKVPKVTFIWREDRFWVQTRLEEWLWRIYVRYSLIWLRPWFLFRQRRAMEKVAVMVRKKLPQVDFTVVGLGTGGAFSEKIRDCRRLNMDPALEKQWCELYAQSHLVVGVHGSSMLIPTALAAGFIELIPKYKLPHLAEDILMQHGSRYQTFLGRHLDLFSKPRLVALHIVEIFSSFPYVQQNTEAVRL